MFFYNGFTIKAFFPRNKSEQFRVLVSDDTKKYCLSWEERQHLYNHLKYSIFEKCY